MKEVILLIAAILSVIGLAFVVFYPLHMWAKDIEKAKQYYKDKNE